MNWLVGVRFQEAGKLYNFIARDLPTLNAGDFVIVETSRGNEMGWVATIRAAQPADGRDGTKPILRVATPADLLLRERYRLREKEALKQVRMAAVELNMPIKLAKAEYSFDGSRLTVYYGSESDIDVSRLQREVVKRLEVRADFRQVGPRDVAKLIGGSGACGIAVRCCSAFLTDFQPISIRMAKAQDLPLVPTEIAGMCGRLRCCLGYEYEFYENARKQMPRLGKWVVTQEVSGKVVDRNIPKETVTLQTEAGTRVEIPVANLWVGESGTPPAQGGSCGPGCSGGCGKPH